MLKFQTVEERDARYEKALDEANYWLNEAECYQVEGERKKMWDCLEKAYYHLQVVLQGGMNEYHKAVWYELKSDWNEMRKEFYV